MAGTTIAGFVPVIILFLTSNPKIPVGGFARKLLPHPVIVSATDLTFDSYYFAGFSEGKLILGNSTAPLHQLSVDHNDRQHTGTINGDRTAKGSVLHVQADKFLLHYPGQRTLHEGNSKTFIIDATYALITLYDDVLSISETKFVTREISTLNGNVLAIRDKDRSLAPLATYIPEKQIDGVFCTDGILLVSEQHNQVLYVYYYRNEFLVLDSTLHLLGKHHTVDTISHAQIQVRTLETGERRMEAPPLLVNKRAGISDDLLFIQSGISSGDAREADHAVIDVYRFTGGHYLGTILVPKYKDIKLRHFAVNGMLLYAIYGSTLITYDISHVSLK